MLVLNTMGTSSNQSFGYETVSQMFN